MISEKHDNISINNWPSSWTINVFHLPKEANMFIPLLPDLV